MTWPPVPPSQLMERQDADTEAVHAADQAVADDALRRRGEYPGDRARVGRGAQHGARVPGPGGRGGDWLAAGGGRHRREPDGAAVRQRRRACRGAVSRRARLGGPGARAQAARRQSDGAVGGIPRSSPGGVCLQPVLPAFPRVRAAVVADHASAARSRAQGVRRLLRQAGADHRPGHGRGEHGGDLRRRAGCVQPDLCRSDLDADAAGLDWRARAHVPVLGRSTAAAGAGQPQERDPQGVVLRPGGEPQLRRWRRTTASAFSQPGQGAHATRPPWRRAYVSRSPTSLAACAM